MYLLHGYCKKNLLKVQLLTHLTLYSALRLDVLMYSWESYFPQIAANVTRQTSSTWHCKVFFSLCSAIHVHLLVENINLKIPAMKSPLLKKATSFVSKLRQAATCLFPLLSRWSMSPVSAVCLFLLKNKLCLGAAE